MKALRNIEGGRMQKVVFVRNWKCGCCDTDLIYDPEQASLTCQCSTRTAEIPKAVLAESFHRKVIE